MFYLTKEGVRVHLDNLESLNFKIKSQKHTILIIRVD